MARIADTFQYDGSMDGLTGPAEERGIGRATKQVLFLEVEGDETNRPDQWHLSKLASDMEDHGKRARIVIGARRAFHRIEVRAEDQWWQWAVRGGGMRRRNDVAKGSTQCLELVGCDEKAGLRELAMQVRFCLL